jgi:serine/threonine protein kinase
MEHCENKTLAEFIRQYKSKGSNIPEDVLFFIDFYFSQIVIRAISCLIHGLYTFYKQRMVHYNIKPENILVDNNYIFKLGVFTYLI